MHVSTSSPTQPHYVLTLVVPSLSHTLRPISDIPVNNPTQHSKDRSEWLGMPLSQSLGMQTLINPSSHAKALETELTLGKVNWNLNLIR